MGLKPINFGDEVRSIAIEKFRAAKGVNDIIAIPMRSIDVAYIHYHPNMGYFYCFQGECCQSFGLPSMRYILPMVQYTPAGPGDFRSYGEPLLVKYLAMGKDSYQAMKLKDQVTGNITTKDLLVSCSDETYQKLTFEVLGEAKWLSDPAMREKVVKMAQVYKSLVGLSVAKSYTPAQFAETVRSLEAGAPRSAAPAPRAPAPRAVTANPLESASVGNPFDNPGSSVMPPQGRLPENPLAPTIDLGLPKGMVDVSPGAPGAAVPTVEGQDFNFEDLFEQPVKP